MRVCSPALSLSPSLSLPLSSHPLASSPSLIQWLCSGAFFCLLATWTGRSVSDLWRKLRLSCFFFFPFGWDLVRSLVLRLRLKRLTRWRYEVWLFAVSWFPAFLCGGLVHCCTGCCIVLVNTLLQSLSHLPTVWKWGSGFPPCQHVGSMHLLALKELAFLKHILSRKASLSPAGRKNQHKNVKIMILF